MIHGCLLTWLIIRPLMPFAASTLGSDELTECVKELLISLNLSMNYNRRVEFNLYATGDTPSCGGILEHAKHIAMHV